MAAQNIKLFEKTIGLRNLKYKIPFHEDQLCKFCSNIYNRVFQIECGCRLCEECVDRELLKEKCKICHELLTEKTKTVDKAFQKEMSNQMITCFHCNWKDKIELYLAHYIESHNEYVCPNCQKELHSIDSLLEHSNDCLNKSCMQAFVCLFKEIGCTMTYPVESDRESHMKEDINLHIQYLYSSIQNHLKNLSSYRINDDFNSQKYIEKENTNFENQLTKQGAINDSYDSSNQRALTSASFQRLYHVFVEDEQVRRELEVSKKNIVELNQKIKRMRNTLIYLKTVTLTIEQKLLEEQKVTSNGIFLWKITSVKTKIQDSKSGVQTSFYSPPFYTHPNGYKMCARVYLNGDGMGRGTHVSVFFVLMKGEYDTLLKWPFRQKVTFTLFDQSESESKENIVDAFKPDPRSTSFTMPENDMNIASGIPLFCPLPKLHSVDNQYIKDDVMFIKISVDGRELIDI